MALLVAAPNPAGAQNLVQDPNFANGFADYTVTGTGGANFDSFADANGNSFTTAVIDAPETLSQTIATTPGESYVIGFLGVFDPGTYTYTFGTGSLTLDGSTGCCTLKPFSFTGIATGNSTDLIFDASAGAEGFTSLDVEAAPAPLPGSGIAALGLGLAAFAIRKRRAAL